MDNLGEGIGIVNTDEIFLFANPNAESIFGVGKGELIARNLKEFFNKEQYLKIQDQTKIRKEGQSSSYESDNKEFIGTLGIFRDINRDNLGFRQWSWHTIRKPVKAV